MLDEEREEEEENELAVEPNEPNNDANSDSTQLYSWPDDSQLPAAGPLLEDYTLPSVIDLLELSQLPILQVRVSESGAGRDSYGTRSMISGMSKAVIHTEASFHQ